MLLGWFRNFGGCGFHARYPRKSANRLHFSFAMASARSPAMVVAKPLSLDYEVDIAERAANRARASCFSIHNIAQVPCESVRDIFTQFPNDG